MTLACCLPLFLVFCSVSLSVSSPVDLLPLGASLPLSLSVSVPVDPAVDSWTFFPGSISLLLDGGFLASSEEVFFYFYLGLLFPLNLFQVLRLLTSCWAFLSRPAPVAWASPVARPASSVCPPAGQALLAVFLYSLSTPLLVPFVLPTMPLGLPF